LPLEPGPATEVQLLLADYLAPHIRARVPVGRSLTVVGIGPPPWRTDSSRTADGPDA